MRTRQAKRVVTVLVAMVLFAVPASEALGATVAGKVRPPSRGAYVGVYKSNLPWEIAALNRYAAESSSKAPAIVMWYQPWGPRTTNPYSAEKFLTSQVRAVLDRGAIPMITWEPWNPGGDPNYLRQPAKQPTYQLADINAGYYDNYIRTWARAVKSVGGPVMIRPMHEMNGMWYPWCGTVNGNSPAKFRAAWRRIHTIFRREGATNVTWVWSPNGRSYPGTYQNRIEAYYPGDAYVDWIGLSGFNWGTSRPGLRWTTFADLYTYPLAYMKRFNKPIVVAEMATVSSGGNKAAWIKQTYSEMRWRYPQIKAVIYYDRREVGLKGVQDWELTSTRDSARAYRRAVDDPYFLGGPVSALSSWKSAISP